MDDFWLRLSAAGPLLYLGLMLAIDPAGMVKCCFFFARGIRMFEQRLHGVRWAVRPEPVDVTPLQGNVMRAIGAAVTMLAFVTLTGLVN